MSYSLTPCLHACIKYMIIYIHSTRDSMGFEQFLNRMISTYTQFRTRVHIDSSLEGGNELFTSFYGCKASLEIPNGSVMKFFCSCSVTITKEYDIKVVHKGRASRGFTAKIGNNTTHNDSVYTEIKEILFETSAIKGIVRHFSVNKRVCSQISSFNDVFYQLPAFGSFCDRGSGPPSVKY